MDLASSLTVIGWFVQVLFDQGITFAIDHSGGAGAAPDLPAALERIRVAINYVRLLLPIARKIRSENEAFLEFVKDLKDAAYEAEDILSELDYYRLQEEAEGNDNSNNTSFGSSMMEAAGGYLEAAGGYLSRLFLTNEDTQASTSAPPPSVFDNKVTILPRICDVVARLELNISGMREVLDLFKPEKDLDADSHVSTSHRVTTSFVSSKETMFGREDTKASIVDLLLNGQPAKPSNVCFLPIIGVGGIGKTTLARAVFHCERVKKHFDCRLWLSVSDNFDVPGLTRSMLEQLGVKGLNDIKNLERLQTLLNEDLRSKKYLVVMDDVWNDADSEKWKTLCGPLERGKTGSRILLTTRLDTVVKMVDEKAINVLGCPVELKGLPKGEYLSLFNKYAFGNEEPSDHPNLAEIGKQIAGKLDGSPLAAMTVGSLLRENQNAEYWSSILSNGIWKELQKQDSIIPVLKLSYQRLPVQLQKCFAYCCVFPKGWSFDGRKLVRMWIAHGYIDTKTSGNKRMEDIGWDYYKILLARSFLEEANEYFFVVHDLFHDLAQSVSADESFIIDTNNQKVPSRVRHLSLSSDHITLILQKGYLRNLRTLIIFVRGSPNYLVLEELLNELKSVRVLYISRLDLKQLLHNIGHLIHLRYLRLYNFCEYRVPSSLCRLYHLQYLDVATKSLLLSRFHEELDCFIIEKGREIGEVENLNPSGGLLTVENLENVYTREESLKAKLSKKIHIQKLRLIWKDSHTLPQVAENVFEGIRPPDCTQTLFIDGYGGVNTPSWMEHEIGCFSNLQSLYLLNCLKWKDLPPLGQLLLLRHLTIDNADAVEVIGREFYGTGDNKGFRRLETLEFMCMPQLVEWSGIGDDSDCLFPRLSKLVINDCPKLEQVPMIDLPFLEEIITNCMSLLVNRENIFFLKKLYIIGFEEPLLPRSVELKSFQFLKQVTLRSCNRLQSLPFLPAMLELLELGDLELLTDLTMEQREKLSDLTFLRELYIKQCPRLSSLPLLPASLKYLEVNCCPRLTSLPLLPASLETLFVHKLMLVDLPSLPTSLLYLGIKYCSHLTSLPLLPASLLNLYVSHCPKLPQKRYQEGGEEWNNHSHIPEIVWYPYQDTATVTANKCIVM